MFDFFEGLMGKIGFKLISDFENRLCEFIKNIKTKSNEEEDNDNGVNYAQIGSSRYSAQIGSSGDYAKIGSSGDSAKIGSSGDSAKIGSSGYYAKIGSSGDSAKIGSSGYSANIGSSGYSANIGSSGDYAKIGSSGDYAQIGSSGYSANIGSSGYSANIGSSGDYAKIGSSGYCAKIDILGDYSIGFACGIKTKIKAKKGTWIALAEYAEENGKIIPIYAKSAQIGNKKYTDNKGNILKSTVYYTLWKKEFYEVEKYDGIETIKISEKKRENVKIIKAVDMETILGDNVKTIYIAKEGKLSAHGYTVREAIEDLTFKKLDNINKEDIVRKIKETGKVTRSQYRALTGACSFGTNRFCEQHNIEELEEIEITELKKILIDDYGAKEFWRLID